MADGATTTFVLSRTVKDVSKLLVFFDGIHQTQGFNIVGDSLVFDEAPPANTRVSIRIISSEVANIRELADGSVSAAKFTSAALNTIETSQLGNNRAFYSPSSATLNTFQINDLTKTIMSSASHADFGSSVDVLVKTGEQTISGVKTFTTKFVADREPITWLSSTGHSVGMAIKGGRLYSACATSAAYNNGATGRGLTGTHAINGISRFKEVPIPSSSPLVKAGLRGSGAGWALMQDGTLYTWGYNSTGCCGLGHVNQVPYPTLSTTDVVEVYDNDGAGEYESNSGCRLIIKKTDGYLYATGHNGDGEFGLSNTTNYSTWQQLTSLGTNVVKVFNLGVYAGCVFVQKSDDTIWVAGRNANGQLGLGNTTVNITTFTDATTNWGGGTGWKLEYVTGGWGYYTTAASYAATNVMLLKNGTTTKVMTCGANTWGGCGDGTTTQRTIPYQIPNSNSVQQISASGGPPCTIHMLNTDGTLYAWGHNTYGAMGDGTTITKNAPTLVQSNVISILSGNVSTWNYGYQIYTAIKKADGVYMTGENAQGQCGLGHSSSPVTSFTKTLFPADADVIEMGYFASTNNAHILMARTADHNLYGWGYNGHNGVHDGGTANVLVPTLLNFDNTNI